LKTISSPLSKIPLEFSGDGGGLISPRLIKVGVKIGPLYPPSPNPSHQGRGILRMPFIPALPGGVFWHNLVNTMKTKISNLDFFSYTK